MGKIHFSLAIHNHQPLGNFNEIFEISFNKSYLPFLEIVKSFPYIKLALHYSGILLDWIIKNHPDFAESLKLLISNGQIELLSGAFYEPILTSLNKADRLDQIKKMNDFIFENFKYTPKGLWLAERVWDSNIIESIADAGLEYAIVDDFHLISAGLRRQDTYGYFTTEEEGRNIALFPSNQTLRYLIPFHPPEQTINFLHNESNEQKDPLFFMGDDGEKFGIWPGTYHTVYEMRWLERFFNSLIENYNKIAIITPGEYLKSHPPVSQIYLPTCSYQEMMVWALPTPAQKKFRKIAKELQGREDLNEYLGFIKGGVWKNFFVKYAESNLIYRKMLHLSNRIRGFNFKSEKRKNEALDFLFQSQCNDAYWHGIFGGLYLPHLRSAIYSSLIKAEKILEEEIFGGKNFLNIESVDLDNDSKEELILKNKFLTLIIKPDKGGSLIEFDYKPRNFNLVNSLIRREEAYHDDLLNLEKHHGENSGSETKTIHETASQKESGLCEHLSYDWYQRNCLIDHFFDTSLTLDNLKKNLFREQGDFILNPYKYHFSKRVIDMDLTLEREGTVNKNFRVKVIKNINISINTKRITFTYKVINNSDSVLDTVFGTEFNFGLLGGNSPLHFFEIDTEGTPARFNLASSGEIDKINSFRIINQWDKFFLAFQFTNSPKFWRFPIETVSNSESGFERIYQSSVLIFSWQISLNKGKAWETAFSLNLSEI
ncbi:MAG: hypothetical protein A2043_08990 [Candidatus Schekmanbacteria bacterium GWA2_38_9]|nr:MAG: hypothetical protein A2043_08990 [Candidatus Schekmanbacteria bacterium GWA2_38_9]